MGKGESKRGEEKDTPRARPRHHQPAMETTAKEDTQKERKGKKLQGHSLLKGYGSVFSSCIAH